MRFVITGYPRSGHAWLANYLYKGQSIVTHEGASFFVGDDSARQAHLRLMDVVTGDCSSSWLLYPDLLRLVPRVVVIDRPREDVDVSLAAATAGLPALPSETSRALDQGFRQALQLTPLVVPYEPVFEVRTLERICRYVGEDFDLVRAALLRHSRVTQDVAGALSEMHFR